MTAVIVHVAEVLIDGGLLHPGGPTLDAHSVAVELRRLYSGAGSSGEAAAVPTLSRRVVVHVPAAETPARALARVIYGQLAERSNR